LGDSPRACFRLSVELHNVPGQPVPTRSEPFEQLTSQGIALPKAFRETPSAEV
jgi:hypothetical protein